jgi:hypothetical protein
MASWSSSNSECLHEEGFLPTSCEAHIPKDHCAPSLLVGEVILVTAFHERVLSLPLNVFLRVLQLHYGLMIHLTPGRVLHIMVFVILCEAFLGIVPHLMLWRYFSMFTRRMALFH